MEDRCERFRFAFRSIVNAGCIPWLFVILMGVSVAARSQTETVLHSFGATPHDGYGPSGGLLLDASGNLFGTTSAGAMTLTLCDLAEVYGCGIVFELTKSNGYAETIFYNFGQNSPTSDGASPLAGLIMDASGNLYGTTAYGGSSTCLLDIGIDGCGTVFELVKPSYTEMLLYTFTGPDGVYPFAGLTIDASGNLYGTTLSGGVCGGGTVFELVKSSEGYTEKVLYSFGCTSTDASAPAAGVILDSAGNLYGTTESGGASDDGTVFELVNSSGDYTEKVLYNFTGSDGQMPTGGLIFDSSGNLYSTTQKGGEYGYGTVFELVNSLGNYTQKVLYSFKTPGNGDGWAPGSSVIMDASGNLYGGTVYGGAYCGSQGCGTVFELVNSSGTYTEKLLHSFGAAGDGKLSGGPLVMDSAGSLYGATAGGGATVCDCGTVFVVNPTAIAPAVILSLQIVNFGSQMDGVTSPPQSVTITNTGSANLTFGSGAVTVSGGNAVDFAVSANTCSGTAVAPLATCSVMVTFTPSIAGIESATLSFADNASTSPQTVSLWGIGLTGLTVSPAALFFGTQALATASAVGAVNLANAASGTLTINSITVSGANRSEFSVKHNCPISPGTLAAGNGCTLQATFTPQATGPRKSAINVAVANSSGSAVQTIVLTGVGTAITTSPPSLTFGSQSVGTPSAPLSVVIANAGSTTVSLYQISFIGVDAGDFSQSETGTCGSSLTGVANCTVNVIFTPAAAGDRTASLMVSNDGGGSPQAVPVMGTGTSGTAAREPRLRSGQRLNKE